MCDPIQKEYPAIKRPLPKVSRRLGTIAFHAGRHALHRCDPLTQVYVLPTPTKPVFLVLFQTLTAMYPKYKHMYTLNPVGAYLC